jgi:hypothetical protein
MSENSVAYSDPSVKISTSSGYVSNGTFVGQIIEKTPFYMPKIQGDALSTIDDDGKIEMSHNHIHIQPANNGFIVTMETKHDGIKTYCFSDFEDVVNFMKDLTMLDIDSERVADNV